MHERVHAIRPTRRERVKRYVCSASALHVTSKRRLSHERRKAHFRSGLCHRKLVEARKGRKMVTRGERERERKTNAERSDFPSAAVVNRYCVAGTRADKARANDRYSDNK